MFPSHDQDVDAILQLRKVHFRLMSLEKRDEKTVLMENMVVSKIKAILDSHRDLLKIRDVYNKIDLE